MRPTNTEIATRYVSLSMLLDGKDADFFPNNDCGLSVEQRRAVAAFAEGYLVGKMPQAALADPLPYVVMLNDFENGFMHVASRILGEVFGIDPQPVRNIIGLMGG